MADSADSLSAEEREFLAALNELGVRYLLVGMSAALLQGASVATDDLDLWFEHIADDRIGQAARRCGAAWVTRSQPPRLTSPLDERFDVVTTLDGLPDFAAEYEVALTVELDGVAIKVLPIERIIVTKRAANREKDRAALPLLETAAKVIRARATKRAPRPKARAKRRKG